METELEQEQQHKRGDFFEDLSRYASTKFSGHVVTVQVTRPDPAAPGFYVLSSDLFVVGPAAALEQD